MDENNKPIGGMVPPSPQTPEVKLRTMESDISSIEKTGGSTPTPQFIPGPIFKPETQVASSASELLEEPKTSGGLKKFFVWLIVLLVAGGLVWAGYIYLWPYLWSIGTVSAPISQEEILPSPEMTKPQPSPLTHKSHFDFSNDILPKVKISDYSIVAILTALQNEANNPYDVGELREALLLDSNNNPISFSKYLATLMPELTTSNLETMLRAVFEDDFTAYLYYDDKGVWPGYVVSIKPNSDIDRVSLNNNLQGLEFASFNNLFLTPPGTASPFRTGQVGDRYTNRFSPLSQPGASFNYGLFDNYLIINTSYSGLLKGLEFLGL